MFILSFLFLIICSFSDLRERSISIRLIAVSLISSIVLLLLSVRIDSNPIFSKISVYEVTIANVLISLLPGVFMIIIYVCAKGAIGMGDNLVILVLGTMLGFKMVTEVLFLSLVLSAVFGIILIAFKRAERKSTLPYIPFVLAAYVVIGVINIIRIR